MIYDMSDYIRFYESQIQSQYRAPKLTKVCKNKVGAIMKWWHISSFYIEHDFVNLWTIFV